MNSTETHHSGFSLLFSTTDYVVFFCMMSLSACIGIFYGFKSHKKEQTVEDYMLGGRKMPLLPVALSLAASYVSGITLLGIPAETYMYGTQLGNICLSIICCYFLMKFFYLPVIYEMQANSLYEYLEKRFDKTARLLASFVFIMLLLLIIPVVIYVPAVAFKQVSGIPIYIMVPLISGVCIFYTSLGGLKAVVWSDALQGGCTLFALIVVSFIGASSVGGFQKILEIGEKGERVEFFNMDPDPFARNTFWTTTLGSIPTWLMAFAAHPSTAQRIISLPTYRHAEIAVFISVVTIVFLKGISTFTGLIIYAKYHDCDPLVTKQIDSSGQILPFYLMDVSGDYPGLAGLFLSGVVCTALSTMSTALNTCAATIYEDFLKPVLPNNITDNTANHIMMAITIAFGVITSSLVFVVARLGTIMQVAVSMQGITNGVAVFLFTFGMFVPWGNAAGVKAGTVAGLLCTTWLSFGAQVYTLSGEIQIGTKLKSVDNCPFNVSLPAGPNSTVLGYSGVGTKMFFSDSVPMPYKISYLYYSCVGLAVCLIVGSVVSLATGPQDPEKLDQSLLIPMMRRKQKPTIHIGEPPEEYTMVPTSENGVK